MKRAFLKTLIFTAYFLAVFVLLKTQDFQLSFAFLTLSAKDLFLWLLGALLGAHFVKLDQLLYVYFTKPDDPLSLQVKELMKQKQFGKTWDLLEAGIHEQKQLASQSFLFQTAWLVLAFFSLTSTAGLFGKALVMAIGFKLLLEEWDEILQGKDLNWLFWQIKRPVSQKEQNLFLYFMSLMFGLLTLLMF